MILASRISKRIAKLEDQFGTAQGKPPDLLVFTAVASELALDEDSASRSSVNVGTCRPARVSAW